jgi:hypothetical protein
VQVVVLLKELRADEARVVLATLTPLSAMVRNNVLLETLLS